ncbi:MAG: lysophospholipid acyltransferase family protein [Armatimonadota bacterium]|nr:lysophospholipid acyltransferase family protein [Armatimonadota bacterium]
MNRTPEPPRSWTWPHYRFVQWTLPRMLRLLGGWRVTGHENVPEDHGAVIASNHLSFLDPPVVGSALRRRTYYFAKSELFVPVFGWIIRKCYAFPVQRGSADTRALKEAVRLLRSGELLTMFPEGTRSRDERVGEFDLGAALAASRAEVPIIPCALTGTNDVLPIGSRWFHRGKVAVSFGEPIDSLQFGPKPGKQDLQRITRQIEDAIRELKAEQERRAASARKADREPAEV